MIAVYTYYPFKGKESCGFKNKNDMAMFLALSVEYSKKHFKKVKLVTNFAGQSILIDKYKIGFTEVSLLLDRFNGLPEEFWAYPKIISYALQPEPFVHIDLDVILWQKIPNKILSAPVFFQHKELFKTEQGYYELVDNLKHTKFSMLSKVLDVDYAFNCGIVGANDLSLVKEWRAWVYSFINENKHFWDAEHNKERYNYVFEQYFIAMICKFKNVEPAFLLENIDNIEKPKFKMTHLWGKTKLSPTMERIKDRLKREFPDIYKRISKIKYDQYHVFNKVYDEFNIPHSNIKIDSIIWLGREEYSSRYMNIDGTVIDFLYSDKTKTIMPKCDLLVIKGMMVKWTPEQYAEFVSGNIPARYIYDGRGIFKTGKR